MTTAGAVLTERAGGCAHGRLGNQRKPVNRPEELRPSPSLERLEEAPNLCIVLSRLRSTIRSTKLDDLRTVPERAT